MTPVEVFARKASGLMRSVDLLGALSSSSAIAAISWAFVWQPMMSAAIYPGSDMGWAGILALIFVIPQIIFYSLMTASMPRSGGDYVWVTRIVSPALGNALFSLFWFGLLTTLTMQYYTFSYFYLPGLLYSLGEVVHNSVLMQFATSLASFNYPQTTVLIVGTFLVIVFCILNCLKLQAVMKMTKWLWYLTVVLSVALIAAIAMTPHEAFVNYVGKETYENVIKAAAELGYGTPQFSWSATIAAIPMGYFLYTGYHLIVHFSGEIREVNKNVPLALIGSAFVGLAFWCAFTWLYTYHLVGWEFNNAAAWLWMSGSDQYPFPQAPSIMYFMGSITTNPILLTILELTFWVNINIIFAEVVPSVRFLFAWSFDRMLPSKIAEVSPRTDTPVIATIVCSILVELCLISYCTSNFLSLYANLVLYWAVVFVVVGIVCAALPYVKKELYNGLLVSKYKVGGVPGITILGLINAAVFGYLTYSVLATPGMSSPPQLYLLFGTLILGIVWYYVARAYWSTKGLDLSLVYKQVPPE